MRPSPDVTLRAAPKTCEHGPFCLHLEPLHFVSESKIGWKSLKRGWTYGSRLLAMPSTLSFSFLRGRSQAQNPSSGRINRRVASTGKPALGQLAEDTYDGVRQSYSVALSKKWSQSGPIESGPKVAINVHRNQRVSRSSQLLVKMPVKKANGLGVTAVTATQLVFVLVPVNCLATE